MARRGRQRIEHHLPSRIRARHDSQNCPTASRPASASVRQLGQQRGSLLLQRADPSP